LGKGGDYRPRGELMALKRDQRGKKERGGGGVGKKKNKKKKKKGNREYSTSRAANPLSPNSGDDQKSPRELLQRSRSPDVWGSIGAEGFMVPVFFSRWKGRRQLWERDSA